MHIDETRRMGEAQFAHCRTRRTCLLGEVCAQSSASGSPGLFPTVVCLEAGEDLWADERYEQRVYLAQEGVFACIASPSDAQDSTAALYGAGDSFGLAELYAQRQITATYRMRALTNARVCSFPARALRRRLEQMPGASALQVVSQASMSAACNMYFQSRILRQLKADERVTMLLGRIAQLARRSGGVPGKLCLGQADLALLAGSDRVCIGRALHRLEEEGLIALGYRSIELLEPFFNHPHEEIGRLFERRSGDGSS